jgi:hypothetical protein
MPCSCFASLLRHTVLACCGTRCLQQQKQSTKKWRLRARQLTRQRRPSCVSPRSPTTLTVSTKAKTNIPTPADTPAQAWTFLPPPQEVPHVRSYVVRNAYTTPHYLQAHIAGRAHNRGKLLQSFTQDDQVSSCILGGQQSCHPVERSELYGAIDAGLMLMLMLIHRGRWSDDNLIYRVRLNGVMQARRFTLV